MALLDVEATVERIEIFLIFADWNGEFVLNTNPLTLDDIFD
jgi:hypothetical protein